MPGALFSLTLILITEVREITEPAGGHTCKGSRGPSDPGYWPQPLPALYQGQRQHCIIFFLSHGAVNFCLDPILTLGREEGSRGPLLGSVAQGGLPGPKAPWSTEQQAFLQRVLVEANLPRNGVSWSLNPQ